MSVACIATNRLANSSDRRYYCGMEPASKIVAALGGASQVADIVGVHRTRVYGWMKPKAAGGTGGLIPFPHIAKIVDAAARQGIRLTGDDFLPCVGAEVSVHPSAHVDAPAARQAVAPEKVNDRRRKSAPPG